MNALKLTTLALSLAGLAASGCTPVLASAEVDAQEVCVSGMTFAFPPAGPAAGQMVAVNTEQPMSFGDLATGLPDDLELEVEVIEAGLSPTAGVDDLTFLDRLGIAAAPVDAVEMDEVQMVEMDQDDHSDDGGMRAAPVAPVDITALLTESDVVFGLEIQGTLPAAGWEGALDVCVHTRAKYSKPL
jgi:hypothetical protein